MATQSGTLASAIDKVTLINTAAETTAMVSVSGTYAGVTVNFEVSNDGGTTFYSVFATRLDTGATETTRVLASNASQLWAVEIAGMSSFRIRASAYTSGTVLVSIIAGNFPIPVSGSGATGNVSVVAAIPTGSNVIGAVSLSGSLPTGSNTIGSVNVASIPTLNVSSQGAVAVLNQASAAVTSSGNSANLSVANMWYLSLGANVTVVSGTAPILDLFLDYLGADSVWYTFYTSPLIASVTTLSENIGPGCRIPAIFSGTIRLRWTVSGNTPSFTFSASIVGR